LPRPGLSRAGPVHRLQVLEQAVNAAAFFEDLLEGAMHFVNDRVFHHRARLRIDSPMLTLGIVSGDTNSGARTRSF
jgi:hypothetical protein